MAKPDILVAIVANKTTTKCEANCGPDWSSPAVMRQARQRVKAMFGDRVQLRYFDLSRPGVTLRLPAGAARQDLPLPRLLINGETRISGQFDVRMLLDTIDAEIEIKR